MKKYSLFLLLFAMFANSCEEDVITISSKKDIDTDMKISVHAEWSDDLLEFVTPVFYYSDAGGVHQMIVEDTMTVDDVWEFEEEVIDLFSRSWNYSFTYPYTFDIDTIRLRMKYIAKEQAEIIDTAIYTFDDYLGVHGVSMSYFDNDTIHSVNYINLVKQESPAEVKCCGTEVRHFIDSLLVHPFERKIYLDEGRRICVK